jgi:hypothetical protein
MVGDMTETALILISTLLLWEPLTRPIMLLRELKGTIARRKVKLMALVLNKPCNTASVPFRSRPKGLIGLPMLFVRLFHQVPTCFQKPASIMNKPISQKHHRSAQWLPEGLSEPFSLLKMCWVND